MLSIYMGVLYLTIMFGSGENCTENSVNPAPNTLQNGGNMYRSSTQKLLLLSIFCDNLMEALQ